MDFTVKYDIAVVGAGIAGVAAALAAALDGSGTAVSADVCKKQHGIGRRTGGCIAFCHASCGQRNGIFQLFAADRGLDIADSGGCGNCGGNGISAFGGTWSGGGKRALRKQSDAVGNGCVGRYFGFGDAG